MSMMKTLTKVAVGVIVAKGVQTMMTRGGSASAGSAPAGGGLGDIMGAMLGGEQSGNGATRRTASAGGTGLEGMMDAVLKGGGASQPAARTTTRSSAPQGGSIEDMLGSILGGGAGGSGGAGGGLGDLLGQLTGATGPGSTRQPTTRSAAGQGGGIEDLLGQLAGAGGLGGLLGSLGAALESGKQAGGMAEPAARYDATPDEEEATAAVLLRAILQAAKSDGKLDEGEQAKILDFIGDATPEEKRFIQTELSKPVDVADLARAVPRGMEQKVYMMSLMGIDLDSKAEAQYLHSLAQAMGLQPQQVNAIHEHLNQRPLYG
jgi:uncharacterized membrane protein YebE (DUF533 family)